MSNETTNPAVVHTVEAGRIDPRLSDKFGELLIEVFHDGVVHVAFRRVGSETWPRGYWSDED